MSPRVSVVMPAFQAGRTVGAAISSVLSQTYRDLELVVVDDGSTDATHAIAAAHPAPVRVISSEVNRGPSAARNRAFEAATGELIALCDADDFLLAGHIEALVELYDRCGGIVAGNLHWLFAGGIPPRGLRYRGHFPDPGEQRAAILRGNFVSIASLFPRTVLDDVGPFDEALRRSEDWEFWLRAIFAGHRVTLQPRPLALYRRSGIGLSSDVPAMDAAVTEVLHRALELDLTPEERQYVQWRLTQPGPGAVNVSAEQALREGSYRDAARLFRQAAGLMPNERPLVWKSRVLSVAPVVAGPFVRRRQRQRQDDLE